ncbi:uncharacterized protein LOC111061701 [Nilaparvata lugens]|uniref:uncharacterized protein LOC111061701 n=1 Tax=Nilaparvata lugens TaxID=108931 RepID=UPI00193E979E|nr:uncharacterized protein LOC111061701 [Nilaparvata lugens]
MCQFKVNVKAPSTAKGSDSLIPTNLQLEGRLLVSPFIQYTTSPSNRLRLPRSALKRHHRPRHSKSSPAAEPPYPSPLGPPLSDEPPFDADLSDLRSEYSDNFVWTERRSLHHLPPAGKGRLTGGDERVRPSSLLRLEGVHRHCPEYSDSYREYTDQQFPPTRAKRPLSQLRTTDDKENEWLKVSEAKARFVAYPEAKRPALRRRSTSLCLEGDLLEKTSELHDSYREYPITSPSRLTRRPTTLRLEGDLDTSRTTHHEQFTGYDPQPRCSQLRRPTNLAMEGDGYFTPEYREKFVDFPRERPSTRRTEEDHVRQIRPGDGFETATEAKDNYIKYPVKRRVPETYCHQAVETDHLRPEGDFEGCSELHSSFTDLPRRRCIARPLEDHLKPEGEIGKSTELKSEFVDFPRQRNIARALEDHLKPEGEMLNSTELNSSFVDFPRQRNISRPLADHLRPEGELDASTEIKSEYVDFPRQRNIAKPIEDHLRPEGDMMNSTELNSSFIDFPRHRNISRPLADHLKPEGDMDSSTEIRSEFVDFPRKRNIARPLEDHLRPEGEMTNVTELNSSFVDFPRARNISRPLADHLKPEGELDTSTEIKSEFVDFPRQRNIARPIEDNLRPEGDMVEKASEIHSKYVDFPRQRPVVKRQCSSLKAEGTMQGTTENSNYFSAVESGCKSASCKREAYLQLGGEIDIRPEYNESFVDHPRKRPEVRRPEEQLRKLEGRIDTDPEYRSSFLDYPRQRPVIKKPVCQLKRSGMAMSRDEASRGPYTPSFLNTNQSGEKAFRVLNVSGSGTQPAIRAGSGSTTTDTDSLSQSAPSYRLHVQNCDDNQRSSAHAQRGAFVVLPDPNNNNLNSSSGSRWLRNNNKP